MTEKPTRPTKISSEGVKLLAQLEGKRYKAYKDSAGLWTTGIGHLITSSEQNLITKTLTESEVLALLEKDLQKAYNVVNTKITVSITQSLFDALVSLAFNTGTLYNSITTLVNNNKLDDLAKKWKTTAITVNNGARVVQGLINRRLKEIEHFT